MSGYNPLQCTAGWTSRGQWVDQSTSARAGIQEARCEGLPEAIWSVKATGAGQDNICRELKVIYIGDKVLTPDHRKGTEYS